MNYKSIAALVAVAFAVAKLAAAAEVSCEYDSNSEWPWADSRVCQVEEKPLLLNDEGTPVCSDARADKDGDGWGWENDRSCVIDLTLPEKRSSVPGLVVVQEDLVVFEQDFEANTVGVYKPQDVNQQWDTPFWHMGLVEERARIIDDAERGKALEVKFPANKFGSQGAVAFLSDLSFGVNFERNFEELYVSYDVKFSENFDYVRGGKLPGLCGYNTTLEPKDGCNTGGGFPTGYDGWSARGMWREEGVLENYMYHADQFSQYGDDEVWDVKPVRGQWHTVQHRVVMNTPGETNGVIEAWLDGEKVLRSDTMLYRMTDDIAINMFYFSTFYGGADPSWAPASDQFIYFDNFRIATTPLDDAPVAEADSVGTRQLVTSDSDDSQAATTALQSMGLGPDDTVSLIPDELADELADELPDEISGELAVASPQVNATNTLPSVTTGLTNNNTSEPAVAAATDLASGGGVFFAWWLGLLVWVKRKKR